MSDPFSGRYADSENALAGRQAFFLVGKDLPRPEMAIGLLRETCRAPERIGPGGHLIPDSGSRRGHLAEWVDFVDRSDQTSRS